MMIVDVAVIHASGVLPPLDAQPNHFENISLLRFLNY